jgi:transposase
MRSVPIKTVEQQAETMIVKRREMLVAQQTQAITALRGRAAEFGVIAVNFQSIAPASALFLRNSSLRRKDSPSS